MRVINNEYIVCVDCDDTLVLLNHKAPDIFIKGIPVKIHQAHVQAIKEHHARGHYVIVWSAGGSAWATLVVQLLGLTAHVDHVQAKPTWYVDDIKDASLWMQHYFKSEDL